MRKEPIGSVEGTTKAEAIDNLTDEQLLALFADFFPACLEPLLSDELKLAAIRQQDLTRALDLSTEKGSHGCGQHTVRVATKIRTFGFREDVKYINGKEYKHTESFYDSGYLWTGRYQTQADKVLRHVLETLFPFLTEFKCQVYGHKSYEKNPQIYVNCERQLYVPISALTAHDADAIMEASQWAAKTWPKAGIFSDEGAEQCPLAHAFLQCVRNHDNSKG